MGCCESRNIHENDINMFVKTNIRSSLLPQVTNFPHMDRDDEKVISRLEYEHSKSAEIPKTKEVKIPIIDIPSDIIKTKKRLTLTIFESKALPEGTILNINPGGLEGSERMAKDGVVSFGTKNEEYLNDFNFPEEDSIGTRHFEIIYNLSKDNYKIKSLYSSGLFIKISKKTLLRNNSIFSFSNTHIIIKISLDPRILSDMTQSTEAENLNSLISLKIINGIKEGEEYFFESNKNRQIKLGRIDATGIDIAFGEESTSRIQCQIAYENNNWYIVDGDGAKNSLNGTWYLADEYIDIYEGMIFRAGNSSIQAHLYEPL